MPLKSRENARDYCMSKYSWHMVSYCIKRGKTSCTYSIFAIKRIVDLFQTLSVGNRNVVRMYWRKSANCEFVFIIFVIANYSLPSVEDWIQLSVWLNMTDLCKLEIYWKCYSEYKKEARGSVEQYLFPNLDLLWVKKDFSLLNKSHCALNIDWHDYHLPSLQKANIYFVCKNLHFGAKHRLSFHSGPHFCVNPIGFGRFLDPHFKGRRLN